jgi:hypothetical protein
MCLYKYNSLKNYEFFVDILVRKRLYGATIRELNDPMEGYFCSENFVNDEWEQLKGLKKSIRICSLTTNYRNALLWAHYANEHKGCCIEVDISKDNKWIKMPINYSSQAPVLNTGINDEDAQNIVFGTKSDFWSYEDEIRFIKKMPLTNGGKPYKAYLPVKVNKVILGIRVTAEERRRVERIVKTIDPNIEVVKIKRDDILFWRE